MLQGSHNTIADGCGEFTTLKDRARVHIVDNSNARAVPSDPNVTHGPNDPTARGEMRP